GVRFAARAPTRVLAFSNDDHAPSSLSVVDLALGVTLFSVGGGAGIYDAIIDHGFTRIAAIEDGAVVVRDVAENANGTDAEVVTRYGRALVGDDDLPTDGRHF